ncbi:HTH-type transcriptional regulator LrpC [archaeon HR06]|nr:HTH-type transcriptional regulator LrpC [archaeon HR06]
MDEIDKSILEFLKENSRISYTEIAKRLNLSEASIRRRVKKLVEKGIIRKFTIEIGQGANAITLVSVNPTTTTSEVAEKLKRIKGVKTVYEITGEYDIATILSAESIAEINKCIDEIRKTEGIINTNTIIVLRTIL